MALHRDAFKYHLLASTAHMHLRSSTAMPHGFATSDLPATCRLDPHLGQQWKIFWAENGGGRGVHTLGRCTGVATWVPTSGNSGNEFGHRNVGEEVCTHLGEEGCRHMPLASQAYIYTCSHMHSLCVCIRTVHL